MRVLLVEPDSALRNIYSQALEQQGYEISHAGSAQQAIHEADAHTPDCVILELQLTQNSGVEFIYEFRSYYEWKNVPIVLHTLVPPHALLITKKQISELGIEDILYKPATNLQRLVSVVRDVL